VTVILVGLFGDIRAYLVGRLTFSEIKCLEVPVLVPAKLVRSEAAGFLLV
jgi:hypothetical protein